METFLFINHNERSCAICYKCVEDLYLIYTYLHFQNSIFQKTRHPFRTEKQKLRQKWVKTTFYFVFSYYIMMPGSKGLSPHELAHMWVKDLRTRPDMSIKVG